MRLRLPVFLTMVTTAGLGTACYEVEFLHPHYTQGPTRVFLKGTPYPYDEVVSVEVYVVEISASTQADTGAGAAAWSQIAVPRRRFDLAKLQEDSLALIGRDLYETDVYYAVRLTIDGDSSVVSLGDATAARIRWPHEGMFTAHATVEVPIQVPDSGASIVVEVDVGRSLIGGLGDPLHDFLFQPTIRAVDSAVTGAVKGVIRGELNGEGLPGPVENAWVSVFDAELDSSRESWSRISLARTDSTGYYRIGYLNPRSYTVQIDAPDTETFGRLVAHDVQIVPGEDFVLSVTLPAQTAAGILMRR